MLIINLIEEKIIGKILENNLKIENNLEKSKMK